MLLSVCTVGRQARSWRPGDNSESFSPLCGFQGPTQVPRTALQTPLPAKSSHWPLLKDKQNIRKLFLSSRQGSYVQVTFRPRAHQCRGHQLATTPGVSIGVSIAVMKGFISSHITPKVGVVALGPSECQPVLITRTRVRRGSQLNNQVASLDLGGQALLQRLSAFQCLHPTGVLLEMNSSTRKCRVGGLCCF